MYLDIREEWLGPHMTKFYFAQPGKPVMHRFTPEIEAPGDPHDHPFGFTSFVLFGGYREQVFMPDGRSHIVDHFKGESFYIHATHIHRIISLHEDECWTIILPDHKVHEWGWWQFREDGAYKRQHDQPDFRRMP